MNRNHSKFSGASSPPNLGAASCFVFHTEQEPSAGEREGRAPRKKEPGKGYADMVLTPLTVRYPALRRGYVVELKYLKRSDEGDALAQAALEAAEDQLRGYLADERLRQLHPGVRFYRARAGVQGLGTRGGGGRWLSPMGHMTGR